MGNSRNFSYITRTIWILSLVSLFTDTASEMLYPIMPIYLRSIGFSMVLIGILEGVAEATAGLSKGYFGKLSDQLGRRAPFVRLGYSLSAISKPLLAFFINVWWVFFARTIDRLGKGIRTGARDALLSDESNPQNKAKVFGFHRSMDHTGAIIGPVLATVFLYFLPDRYRLLFALTAIPGAIAVAMLFLVREDDDGEDRASRSRPDDRLLPGRRGEAVTTHAAPLPGRLYALLAVILIFSLGNSADAFLLLRLSDALGAATYVPLLWSAHHVVKAGLSTWGGGLSDRVGRKQVIVAGWIVYAVVYLGFAWSASTVAFIAWFLIYGVYFALTEGAEKALVADLTPVSRQGTAFGLYYAALGAGALVASVMFGYIYDHFGASRAFTVGAGLAGIAAIALFFVPSVKMNSSNAAYSRNQ